jgi:phosphoglucomutase
VQFLAVRLRQSNRHWRRRKRRTLDSASRAREGWHPCRLLCCEAVARRGKSLGEQLKALCNQVGSYYPQRENFRLTPEVKAKFTEKLRSDPRDFNGRTVSQIVRTDGLKLLFSDGSWVCYRLSGTEPVVRVYTEGTQ